MVASKTAGSEQPEVGTETELHRENSELVETAQRAWRSGAGKREFETTLSMIIAVCNSHFSHVWCMGWGGSSKCKGPVASGTGSGLLLYLIKFDMV